jgi:hypothetical protein
LPAAGELEEAFEFFGRAFVAEALGDGEKEAEALGGGVKGDGVGIVGVDPAVFGDVEDLCGKGRAEGAGFGGGGGEDEFGLGVVELAGGGGPGGAFLRAGGAFFFEHGVPFGVERRCIGGDGEGQGQIFEAGVAGLGAAHPHRFAGEGDGGAGGEFFGRGDLGLEEDIALIALGFEGEHEDAFGFGVFEFGTLPAARKVPLDGGGHADDSGLLPVGVEAGFVMDEDTDVEGGAGLDVGDLRNEVDGEADAVLVGRRAKGEKQRECGEERAGGHGQGFGLLNGRATAKMRRFLAKSFHLLIARAVKAPTVTGYDA